MAVTINQGLMPSDRPRVVVYVDEEIKADLERLAASQDRPVSNFVLQLIKQAIAAGKASGAIPTGVVKTLKAENGEGNA